MSSKPQKREDKMGFDLAGMETQRRRSQAKITVLTKPDGNGWSEQEVSTLIGRLRPMTEAYGDDRQHPTVLMLYGEFPKETIVGLLGGVEFEHRVVTGLDNPDLPFRPPSG